MTDLVVRQTATGSYAIGWINFRKSKGFIPRDGIRFSTREAAEAELRAEQERDKPTDIGGGVMV
jgi:hypothetical protein